MNLIKYDDIISINASLYGLVLNRLYFFYGLFDGKSIDVYRDIVYLFFDLRAYKQLAVVNKIQLFEK